MSADIEKLAVFDSRIVQSRPKYAVEKGALSLTNAPFNAISATASQHTYNIYVPSENVFVDRGLEWASTVRMTFNATSAVPAVLNGGPSATGRSNSVAVPTVAIPMLQYGVDWSLCSFPLNSMCSTLTATINDTTSVINSQDVLKEVLRLTDYKKNRLQRTCPTMLDKYQSYNDSFSATNNAIGGFTTQTDFAETPNGAFTNITYTDAAGVSLLASKYSAVQSTGAQNYQFSTSVAVLPIGYVAGGGAPSAFWVVQGGAPVLPPPYQAALLSGTGAYVTGSVVSGVVGGTAGTAAGSWWYATATPTGAPGATAQNGWSAAQSTNVVQPYWFTFTSTEKLVLSPFTFSDVHDWDTGLFGINNIQLIMNLQTPTRLVRSTIQNGVTVVAGSTAFSTGTPFQLARVNAMFLTPSLDVPLPPKSVVPYMEFPRYITQPQFTSGVAPGAIIQLQSQTITLPQIPDLFIIYAKPNNYNVSSSPSNSADTTQGDWYLPPASIADGVASPLSINFDNFSGLLSSVSTEQLYAISVKNGLDMDYNSWLGTAHTGIPAFANGVLTAETPSPLTSYPALGGGLIPTVGGFLVLKPSQDITLQTGQAPSLVGNFTFQFNLQVKNTSNYSLSGISLYVITANSGFFESIRGSSRIIKGVLSEQDIISAPLAPQGTRDMLQRYVGGGGMFSSLANMISRAKDIYDKTKPMVSAAKGLLPDSGFLGNIKSGLSSVGYGSTGAGHMGAGVGAGSGGRRRGIESRLM